MAALDRLMPTGSAAGVDSDGAGQAQDGVESNARLTASTAVVLLVLLAAEGLTILSIHGLLSPHVFIGMLLVPPVLLKTGSTTWRFVRYYRGAPAYRRKGPPPLLLRLLGPLVVALTVVVLASGIALLFVPRNLRQSTLFLHKASFVLWFGAMAIHVVGHILETTRLAPKDWVRTTRTEVRGAGLRQWAVVASVALGIPLGLLFLGRAGHWSPRQSPSINAAHAGHRLVPAAPAPPRAKGAQTPAGAPTTIPPSHVGTLPRISPPTVPAPRTPTTAPARPAAHGGAKSRPHHHAKKAKKGA